MQDTQIRYIISAPRSMSSAFHIAVCQNPDGSTYGIFEPLRDEYKKNRGFFEYSVFKDVADPDCHPAIKENPEKTFIMKDVIGRTLLSKINGLFPTIKDIQRSKPLFLFRHPISVYASIKKLGWYNVGQVAEMYRATFDLYHRFCSSGYDVNCITAETVLRDPQQALSHVCQEWRIEYSSAMVDWGPNPLENICDTEVAAGLSEIDATHEKLLSSKGLIQVSNPEEAITKHAERLNGTELSRIARELVPIFEAIKRNEIGSASSKKTVVVPSAVKGSVPEPSLEM